jgi:hypothetical protein
MKSKPSNCTNRAGLAGRSSTGVEILSLEGIRDTQLMTYFQLDEKLLHRRHPQTRYPPQESFLLTRQLTVAHKTVAGLRVNL